MQNAQPSTSGLTVRMCAQSMHGVRQQHSCSSRSSSSGSSCTRTCPSSHPVSPDLPSQQCSCAAAPSLGEAYNVTSKVKCELH
jgi:hypothetical protein